MAAAAVALHLAITLPLAFVLNVWQDDAYTLHSTAGGVANAFHESVGFEQNAPLYFVVMTLWRDVSLSPFFARLFSVLCTAVSVALLPSLAARYLPRADARWLVPVLAINPFLIWAALEIRVYALIVLMSVLLLFAFYEGFLRDRSDRRAQILFSLCVATGLYTQYYFAFLIAALGAFLFFAKNRRVWAFLVWACAGLALFVPMVVILPAQVQNFQGAFAGPASPMDTARDLLGSLVRYVLPLEFLSHATPVYVVLIVLAAAALFLARRRFAREGDGTLPIVTSLAFAIFTLGLYAAHVHLLGRHAASLFVPSVFSTVAILTFLRPAYRAKAIAAWCSVVAAASAASLAFTYSSGAKPGDWERVAAYIESHERPGEPIAVFQAENALPFEYYYRGPNKVVAVPHALNFKVYDVRDFIVRDAASIDRVLPHTARRVWWIHAGDCTAANIAFGCEVVERYIAQHYRTVSIVQFYKADVRLLIRRSGRAIVPPAARFADCPVFAPNSYYNRAVSNDPPDRHSADYIASMAQAGNTGTFWAAAVPVEFVNVASEKTPMRTVRQKVPYHRFDERYPWSPGFKIEPLSDAHAMVISRSGCRLFETYETSFDGDVLSAYSGAAWDLRKPFQPLAPGDPSAMASGLSLFAGMVKWEEIEAGRIDHALNWAAPAGSVSQYGFVRPASDTDQIAFKGSSSYQLPYGAHLRLKRSFDISAFGPQSKIIAQAMKTYGIYLADTGSDDNAVYNAMPLDGINRWNSRDLASLSRIHISDFDVLELGPIMRVPGH